MIWCRKSRSSIQRQMNTKIRPHREKQQAFSININNGIHTTQRKGTKEGEMNKKQNIPSKSGNSTQETACYPIRYKRNKCSETIRR